MATRKIYFIKSSNDGGPSMEEAFLACKSQQIETLLCDIAEFTNVYKEPLNPNLRTVVVIDTFSGDDFDKLKELENIRLVGPLCVLACLNDGISIPNCNWPLLSIAMKGARVCCSSLSKTDKVRIKELVILMNGESTDECLSNTTHLITNSTKSIKYTTAVENGISIMTAAWIDAIWMESQNRVVRYTHEQFDQYKCPVFYNLRICVTGIERPLSTNVVALIQKHGGLFTREMHLSKTDILICHSENFHNSSKYKAVMTRRGLAADIRCVNLQWLHDSIKNGYTLPADNYFVHNVSSPHTKLGKENDMDPEMFKISKINATNMSMMSSTTFDDSILPKEKPKRDLCKDIDLSVLKKASTFLDGCNIYLICFTSDEVTFVHRALKYTGATRLDTYSDRISHVVVGDDKNEACRQELRSVMERMRDQRHQHVTHLVTVRWLIDSIKKQTPLAEDAYTAFLELSPQNNQNMDGSPLSKKGLKLLRTDTSIRMKDNSVAVDGNLSDNVTFKAPKELQQYMQTDGKDDETFEKYWNDVNTEELAGVETLKTATENSVASTSKAVENKDESNFLRIPKKRIQNKSKTSSISVPAADQSSNISKIITTPLKRNDTTALDSDQDETLEPPFRNQTFQLLQFPTEAIDELTKLINQMGGCVVSRTSGGRSYRGVTDFAIVPLVSNRELTRNVTSGHCLTDIWLRECASNGRFVNVDYYHRSITEPASNVLNGCVVSTSGLTQWEQTYISAVIDHLGGRTQGDLCRSVHVERDLIATTHLLTNTTTNKKYTYAHRWRIPIVTARWAAESLHAGKRVPELDFPVVDKVLDGPAKVVDQSKIAEFASPGLVTPRCDKMKRRMCADVLETPQFQSPVLSQPSPNEMSPVRKKYHDTITRVKSRVDQGLLYDSDCDSPTSTRLADLHARARSTDSPVTPFSNKVLGPTATRADRKELREFVSKIPTNTASPIPPSRRLSTPLSELRRRFIAKVDDNYEKEYEKLRTEAKDRRKALDQERQEVLDAGEGSSDVFMDDQTDSSDMIKDVNTSATNVEPVPAHIVQEKMRNLLDVLSASTPIQNNKSTKPISVTPVTGFSDLPDSQTYSVGWDYDVDVNATKQPTTEAKDRIFVVTGCLQSDKDSIQSKIELLGAKVATEQMKFDEITHLLCTNVSRKEKTLCGIASGKWVLHMDYIEESLQAGKFLDEELFEFSNPKSKVPVDSKDEERARSAVYWRQTVVKTGKGAFHDMRAIIVSKGKENSAFANIVEAGGGTIVQSRPPYENNDYATHCLIETKMTDLSDLVPLAKCGIYCVPHIFLCNFLVNRNLDILQAVSPKLACYYSK